MDNFLLLQMQFIIVRGRKVGKYCIGFKSFAFSKFHKSFGVSVTYELDA